MIETINTYFKAEKAESLLFMLIGLITITLSIYFYFGFKKSFYWGMAAPLFLIGMIQMVVGSTVYFRTDAQIDALSTLYQAKPQQFKQEETPRMEKVMQSFQLYKYIEIAFVLIGVMLILFLQRNDFYLGLGLGMLTQGTLMLIADIFAERRGEIYLAAIKQLL